MSDNNLASLRAKLEEFSSQGRTALLPALQLAQSLVGYIPESVAVEVGRALSVPLSEVHGVIEFYSMLYREPVGKRIIRACTDPVCAMAGGEVIVETICHHLGVNPGETSPDGEYTLERATCLGLCEHAPSILVDDMPFAPGSNNQIQGILAGTHNKAISHIGGDFRLITALCGLGSPVSLQEFEQHGGYSAFRKALTITPESIIAEIKASGLVGRGGAAFPTGVKWEGASKVDAFPKYVVCNADESEPGTFKDRILLEEVPHQTIEGMLIAGLAIGAQKGYIYIRGEYPIAYQVMQLALEEALQAGFLGKNIRGSSFCFEIELRRGAGAYICGEETALFESIEGKRGFPRVKPPFPTTHGLFGKPTVINNVETLCNIPLIITIGADKYRQIGTKRSPGPKLFCVSGDVKYPGLYEVPFGITLRHLLFDLAGGMSTDHKLKAILFGGAAGAFASDNELDIRLSFEDLKTAGLPLGSGVVMVFDERRDLLDVVKRLARFFAHESCGKCYPCQLGTQRQYEILTRIASGSALPEDSTRLADIGWTMTDASLCGLGQTAATAVISAMNLWPELFSPVTER